MIDMTHPFAVQILAALRRAAEAELEAGGYATPGAPPPVECPDLTAPPLCDIQYRHTSGPKFRAKVWYDGATRSIGYFPMTVEGRALAERAAEAARRTRECGGNWEEIRRAGREAGGLLC